MKKLLAILALLVMTTPALGKTLCKAEPTKGLSHYRLIDGKKCWYQGKGVAKAELTWNAVYAGKAKVMQDDSARNLALVTRATSPGPAPTKDKSDAFARAPVNSNSDVAVGAPASASSDKAEPMAQILGEIISLNDAATDYAIAFACGDVNWGLCERRSDARKAEVQIHR
jgi:hypothetical protein